MKPWTRWIIAAATGMLVVVSVVAPPCAAQTDAPQAAPGAPTFKPEELEQIAAPIALYPDPLLAQIFMAATYPVEIVQAARFAQANPNLKGDQVNEELQKYDWDDSVKSLVSFPDVLTMMNEKLDWTQKLGDAVLGQQKELMDAIQRLRAKAQASGNLKTTEQQNVTVEPAPAAAPAPGAPPPQIVTIQPANPQVIYVPTYEPAAVYGGWPYPAYPPYSYYPPGYVAGTAMLSFGVGMAVGAAVWGGCNWGHGEIDVDVDRQSNFNRNVNRTSNTNTQRSGQRANAQGGKQGWQHDPGHRKGAQYRDTATQQRYNKQGVPNSASREAYRGRAEQGRQELARDGGAGAGAASGANRAATRESGQVGGGARGGAESASVGSGGGRAGGGESRAAAGGGGGAEARSAGAGGGAQSRSAGAGGSAQARSSGAAAGGGQARSAAGAGAGGQRAGGAAFEGAGQGRSAQSYSQRGGSSMSSARASGYQGGGGGARAGGGGARGGGGGGRR